MAEKKTIFVMSAYSDGSLDYAAGDHAQEVMNWFHSCEMMQAIHGGQYTGRRMIIVPAEPTLSELEPLSSIIERTFPELVAELRRVREG